MKRVQRKSNQHIHPVLVTMVSVQQPCLQNQVWEVNFSSQQIWPQRLRRSHHSVAQGHLRKVGGKEELTTTIPLPWVKISTRISEKAKKSLAKKNTTYLENRVLPFHLRRPNQVVSQRQPHQRRPLRRCKPGLLHRWKRATVAMLSCSHLISGFATSIPSSWRCSFHLGAVEFKQCCSSCACPLFSPATRNLDEFVLF